MGKSATDGAARDRSRLMSVIRSFVPDSDRLLSVDALGRGNINTTYLVSYKQRPSLVVQRINETVFPDPIGVARNVDLVTTHLEKRCAADPGRFQSCRFPRAIELEGGRTWFEDRSGSIWRCLTYIENGVSYPCVRHENQAAEAGRMLGSFHALLEDFDDSALVDPLPGFHDLRNYARVYLKARETHRRTVDSTFRYCRKMIEDRLTLPTLEERSGEDEKRLVVIHGDPKCDNFLFDPDSGRALALIDLDTVGLGRLAVDIGDCLRSFCNPAGENAGTEVVFDSRICAQLLSGYFQWFDPSTAERSLIYHGVRQLTYELGLRFFTDHLNGDRYFRITAEGENLRRAWVQFKLLESIESQRSAIERAAGIG